VAATDQEANEWLQAALAQHRSGKLPQAEALYRKVLQVNPANPGALTGLGLIALKIGELDAAGRCFEAVLKINPRSGETHRFLSRRLSTARFCEVA
jgi:Tfp pilus assembly protein PilF